MKALFLDMDSTLIKTKSKEKYPINIDDWIFIDGALKTAGDFIKNGYLPIIVTNQGGISDGYITKDEVDTKINNVIRTAENNLKLKHGTFKYYFAETNDKDDIMRKPNPGMAIAANLDHKIDLANSIMVGDMSSDEGFAKNAGIGTFYWASDFAKMKNIEQHDTI